ncbi:copper/zinc superoxide dismutase [Puccinia triticina 1-1 BBBD Race 1]|uniref:superoxide dismutase n=2 Tax=Puccinia triticina TaxID=208348 RepID=A0A180GFP7_PUCT1|nr:uncharacterized protein PtA15_3A813 [Puccinia triticina]OAV91547.1 copper/zinc superoxide dismutase [Puccinia triticina 1-1 BBBD Race 1]WAQ83442.1 hypothetical protein PtA15_3A813 [Puccinia triticina]WAR54281.1 hypothetical protein PtB15_3B795 [Puccinia triticina]
MRSSVISGLVCLSLSQYSEGLPQPPLLQSTRAPQSQPIHARAMLVSPLGAPIFGVIDFRSTTQTDVQVEVVMNGLDQLFPHAGHAYHIHTSAVGADGNCEAAGAHLTPNGIPDSPPCNPMTPRSCQEGDLSGKHGLLSGNQRSVHVTYTDNTLQLLPSEAGIIGRGVVVHDAKGARIACGNITRVN